MGKLNQKKIRNLSEPGRYADGSGLYFHLRPGGSRQWILRIAMNGRRSDIGLGSAELVSLEEARLQAFELRKQIRAGTDILAARRKKQAVPTFEEVCRTAWEQKRKGWRNKKHAQQWINTLKDYAFPILGKTKVDAIVTSDIIDVLKPIWLTKPETASRLLQRLRVVFEVAKTAGHYNLENPVIGVRSGLPNQNRKVQHHTALPWQELPAFFNDLGNQPGIASLALRFLILTASRSGEVRGATWDEIDLENGVWEISSERMKANRPHRVPLSDEARRILKEVRGLEGDLVFPGLKAGKPLSDMVFKALFKRMRRPDLTAHGFRSTFRDCCSDHLNADWELSELSLAHNVGTATERAYARSDQLEKRRVLMDRWAEHATSSCQLSSDVAGTTEWQK